MGVIFRNDIPYGRSNGGDNSKELTYEEYLALSEEEKKNGTTYYVPDAKSTNISTILNTKEEIEANTEENKIAGALAVKEVIEEVNSKFEYTTLDELLSITEKPTTSTSKTVDISGYKKIMISFHYGYVEHKILDVDILRITTSVSFTLGYYKSASYYAFLKASFTHSGTLNISTCDMVGWNFNSIKVYGIK